MEVKEETGLDVSGIKFLVLQEFIFDKAFHKKKHFLFIDYECRAKSTKVKLSQKANRLHGQNPEKH